MNPPEGSTMAMDLAAGMAFVLATSGIGCGLAPREAPSPVERLAAERPAARAATGRVRVNGVELAYTDTGAGEPIVFVHGFPLSRGMWEPQRQALGRTHRVVTIDLPGFGESQPHPGKVSMEALADDVAAVVARLRLARPVLVGHSMGGYVALSYARRHPAALRGLVLVSTDAEPAAANPADTKFLQDLAKQVRADGAAPAIEALAPGMAPAGAPDPALERRARALMASARPVALEGCLLGMADRAGALAWLPKAQVPALVLVGDADQVIPPEASRRLAREMPHATLTAIAGAGHLLPLERAAEVNEAIRAFAARASAAGAATP